MGSKVYCKLFARGYQWLCEDVLQILVPYVADYPEGAYSRLCKRLHFKRYWDMNEVERKEYLDNKMMDYDASQDEHVESEMTDDEKNRCGRP